jgi:hypothetical protein
LACKTPTQILFAPIPIQACILHASKPQSMTTWRLYSFLVASYVNKVTTIDHVDTHDDKK